MEEVKKEKLYFNIFTNQLFQKVKYEKYKTSFKRIDSNDHITFELLQIQSQLHHERRLARERF